MFSDSPGSKCQFGHGYHDARVFVGKSLLGEPSTTVKRDLDLTDPRWPAKCACGYVFQPADEWQLFTENEYLRADTGEECTIDSAPPGAIWNADWYEDMPEYVGPDGKCYVVKTPDGYHWVIDGPASNCTMRDDKVHKCWVRHGEAPNFTVDKNGYTCAAGGGSILTPKYHGFLQNGFLTDNIG